jgi:ferric-dicitrate binding protein FerR (iron transport regulator)
VSETHEEIRALRLMVEELRAERPPELPWEAMEQRLMSRVAASELRAWPGARRRPVSALPRVLMFAAAAAAIALGVRGMAGSDEAPSAEAPARPVDAARVAEAPGAAHGERDLAALEAGDVIEAGAQPVSFGRDGLVTWTLAPGSAARVRSMGDRASGVGHTLALERGSIRAEVTPRDPAEGLVEAFAVEVGGTRVAVHGTAFSVTIDGGRAVVDVDHGAVAVGPVGHVGATTGHLLVGPARAVFSLDGGKEARLLPRAPQAVAAAASPTEPQAAASPASQPVAVAAESTRPAAHAEPQGAVAAAQPSTRAAQAPSSAAAEAPEAPAPAVARPMLTEASVRARLDQCFRQTHDIDASSTFSVESTLRIRIRADGTVASAQFSPALKPAFTVCAGTAIDGRFSEGERTVEIPFVFKP